jgi:CubicO group peptidase (beta-lactamase class C family)
MRYVFLLFLLVSLSSRAQEIEGILDEIRQDHEIVGMAVRVSCQGDELLNYHSGLRHIDLQLPLLENTLFRVASISKSFTAAGLLRLYDQGLFGLDDDVGEALGYEIRNPNFPDVPITYRMLLSHTSSLQDGTGYGPFLSSTYNSDPIPGINQVLLPAGDFYTSNMWRQEAPGTFFAYSNINYGLIGTLIEALSGERFDVYMKTGILEPLGIGGSYNVNDLPYLDQLSVLYRDGNAQVDDYGGVYPDPIPEGYVPGTNGSRFAPQGGLRCSSGDLLAFANMLLNGGLHEGIQILEPETVDLMLSEQWEYNGANGDPYFGLFRNWGLGVHRAEGTPGLDKVFENTMMIGHPGEAYGLISDLYLEPESGLALVFVSNGYYSGGGYAFAENSIFYAPEEETFEAVEANYLGFCSTLPTEQLFPGKECVRIVSGMVTTDADNPIEVYELSGKEIGVFEKGFHLSHLPKGMYLVKVISSRGACIRKLGIH